MRHDSRPRWTRAFTLIELLTVVGIIALLIALSLPAMLAAREALRKAHCQSNLKQIGLALHNYYSAHQGFPGGINGGSYSWHTMILPHLDQSPTYNSINFSGSINVLVAATSSNYTAAKTNFKVLMCPSEAIPDSITPVDGQGRTNYLGNGGVAPAVMGFNGLFINRPGPSIGFSALSDGASQTAAVAEVCFGGGPSGSRDSRVATYDTSRLVGRSRLEQFIEQCEQAKGLGLKRSPGKQNFWISANYGETLMNHTLLPNGNSCTNGGSLNRGAYSASSYHSGGVNLLFADGHVKTIGNTVSRAAWAALSTRSGGEVAGDNF